MQLADDIVDNPALNKWYGTYPIGEHGLFLINCAKAKMLLARSFHGSESHLPINGRYVHVTIC